MVLFAFKIEKSRRVGKSRPVCLSIYLPQTEWEQSFQIGSLESLDSEKQPRLEKPTY